MNFEILKNITCALNMINVGTTCHGILAYVLEDIFATEWSKAERKQRNKKKRIKGTSDISLVQAFLGAVKSVTITQGTL